MLSSLSIFYSFGFMFNKSKSFAALKNKTNTDALERYHGVLPRKYRCRRLWDLVGCNVAGPGSMVQQQDEEYDRRQNDHNKKQDEEIDV
ncbi:hypothetical protein DPMN_069456 [Dreissena polymorpha]|uniref:Uncharacterized protein n=1 Tax=Dreissena polymorpha TaxID=45954 RepID=A0A9D3Z3K1_DREPO|nr:hypothetical protein DPMN_069456 [Dreissena polymorpha]